jgi:hypothetical protein
MWRNVKGLLHPGTSSTILLPGLCQSTASFFATIIFKVQASVNCLKSQHAPPPPLQQPNASTIFHQLELTLVSEVSKLIMRLPNITYPLDFIHTSIIKSCSDVMVPLIAQLVNLSFSEGRFPSKFRLAQISPVLKKADLDKNNPVKYRSISNWNNIGKIIEHPFLARLTPQVVVSCKINLCSWLTRNCIAQKLHC